MTADPRMTAARNGTLNEAFLSAFGQGSGPKGAPGAFELDEPASREQAPQQAAAPLQVVSAQTARLLQLQPDQLAAEIEKLAGIAMAESRARHAAESKLRQYESTPSAQLAAIRRGTFQ